MDADRSPIEPSAGAWTAVGGLSLLACVGLGVYAVLADAGVLALLIAVPFVLLTRLSWRRARG